MRLHHSTQHAELISPLSSVHPERAQAGAFLPKLLEQAGLLKEAKTTKGARNNAQEIANTVQKATEESTETVWEDAEKVEETRKQAVMQRYAETDEAILKLNVILVYKKVVQGLIYSPPDCDKHLGLDAEPLGPTASPLASVPTQAAPPKHVS